MLPISSTLNSTAVRLSLAALALLTAAGGAIAVPSPARADDTPTTTVSVADPQHRARRLPATLSVRAVPRGDDATVRGTLRSGRFELRGRLVVLLAQPSGQAGWQYAGAHRTGRDGRVDFGVAPATSTAYRLQFLGTTVFRPARSGVVRLAAVAPRPSVSISAAPQLVDRGATTTVSGTVTSAGLPLGGAVVDLLARPTGGRAGFDTVASATTGADGTVALVTSPTRDTTYRLRVQQTATTSPTHSAAVRVQVRAATSLSIRQRTAPAGLVVSGTLRSQGRPVVGKSVALMAQVPGSTTWVQVATDRTARRGGVSFVQPPAPGTGYRLEFVGTPRLSASTSGVVVG